MKISEEVKELLCNLADKFETEEFYKNDPSKILHRYENPVDTEVAAFIMALLSFGRRDLFLKKAEIIFTMAKDNPSTWIKSGQWQTDFPSGETKFYRFYSFNDFRSVFDVLQNILLSEKSFGDFIKKKYSEECEKYEFSEKRRLSLDKIISLVFKDCKAVPHTEQSANKRINMFLRWMVRTNSPVDVGLWNWFSPKDLIIPLDTHVLQESIKLGLVPEKSSGSMKTAILITDALRQVWPNDPCKGDFALFGLGVN